MLQKNLQNFIKKISQHSILNRDKFIKNKIKYNIVNSKNNNLIKSNLMIKRHITSLTKNKQHSREGGEGIPPNNLSGIIVLAMSIGIYNNYKKR